MGHFVSSVATSNFLRVHFGISHTKLNKGGAFLGEDGAADGADGATTLDVVRDVVTLFKDVGG